MKKNVPFVWTFALIVCVSAPDALGADWPMWRHDPNRSAATAEDLPKQLHLQWSRELPPIRPAWPMEPRLGFDASYEPVVMGRTIFLGSPNHGSVIAFDADTGREKWVFYTEGPVRFAPVAWKGKVYVGSDDGFLYCLDAASGSLRWKVRGAPRDRPDRRHLGNGRLISFWPVRGGPVLKDGIVFFAAGIWPTMGVFVVAVDARSGRVVWRRDDLNLIKNVRIDHNVLRDSGLSPQGYLVAIEDRILVPNGRSMPAGLDRKTGKLLYYLQGYRRGDSRVTALGEYAFVGSSGVIETKNGREVGSRWEAAGDNAPRGFDVERFDLFEGPIFAYKLFAACSAASVLTPGVVYGSHAGTFYAYDIERPKITEYSRKLHGRDFRPWRWALPPLWRLRTKYAKKRSASAALIKAGNRLYGHTNKTLLAMNLPTDGGKPSIAWTKELPGTPSSMLAADGRLFVVTKEGGLLCFGGTPRRPVTYPRTVNPLPTRNAASAKAAKEILDLTGVSEGYCLVLGLGTGRLMEELLRQSDLIVIGVDSDPDVVRRLRKRLIGAGGYGTRAEVFVGNPLEFPFPPYLANLIVVGGEVKASTVVSSARFLFATLRPYGGVACLALRRRSHVALAKRIKVSRLANAVISRAGAFTLLRREGALPDSSPWTHGMGSAARSFYSKDRLVRAPLGILWYGNGFRARKTYGKQVTPQVLGGRMIGLQWKETRTLCAYDVYTGRPLWTRELQHRNVRYASVADAVYVAEGSRCTVLDAETGEVRARFEYETGSGEAGVPDVKDIRVSGNVILIALSLSETKESLGYSCDSDLIVALDRVTGETLWKRKAEFRFIGTAIAMGNGTVFCTDAHSSLQLERAESRGEESARTQSKVMALDARTGTPRWTVGMRGKSNPYSSKYHAQVRKHEDWLAYADEVGLLLVGKAGDTCALEAATGNQVWRKRIGGCVPAIVRGKTFIVQYGMMFDTRTGKPLTKTAKVKLRGVGGCVYAVACESLIVARKHSVCYVGIATGQTYELYCIRSGCSNSIIPADGLLNVPDFAWGCSCNYPIQTSFAMVHMPEVARWAGGTPLNLR